ncbi:MAG: hypothetical protein RLZZ387_2982 [Chloroflexota bacterium]
MLLQGATDTLAFDAFIDHVLAPSLRPGQVVVLDNLSAHKGAHTAKAITDRGCELWFLPSYSPDLSPIEQAFAKLKNHWRKEGARTAEALLDAVSSSLPSITPGDARSFFRDCGYQLPLVSVQSL